MFSIVILGPGTNQLYARVGSCGDSCRLDESSRLEYGATSWKIEKPFLDFKFPLFLRNPTGGLYRQ